MISISRMARAAAAVQLAVMFASCHGATAAAATRPAAAHAPSVDDAVAEIQQSLDERRYLDASRMLDEASLSGARDPRFDLLAGELSLAQGQFSGALAEFKKVADTPGLKARALQGRGVALLLENKTDEAITALEAAVAQDAKLWRAWNALGGAYDLEHQWDKARDAYDHAITASNGAAAGYNNRGYSLLLQGKADAAVADLVEALRLEPDLAEARTNLRLALALKGDYGRAVSGGAPQDEAAALNNAGFAAIMRGDFSQAEDFLTRAMKLKGEYYARAAANLDVARQLRERSAHEN